MDKLEIPLTDEEIEFIVQAEKDMVPAPWKLEDIPVQELPDGGKTMGFHIIKENDFYGLTFELTEAKSRKAALADCAIRNHLPRILDDLLRYRKVLKGIQQFPLTEGDDARAMKRWADRALKGG